MAGGEECARATRRQALKGAGWAAEAVTARVARPGGSAPLVAPRAAAEPRSRRRRRRTARRPGRGIGHLVGTTDDRSGLGEILLRRCGVALLGSSFADFRPTFLGPA